MGSSKAERNSNGGRAHPRFELSAERGLRFIRVTPGSGRNVERRKSPRAPAMRIAGHPGLQEARPRVWPQSTKARPDPSYKVRIAPAKWGQWYDPAVRAGA